jgi:hypothetical protein
MAEPTPATPTIYAEPENAQTDHAGEEVRARFLAERYQLEFLDLDHFHPDHGLFRSIPADLMLRYGFVPYRREGQSLVDRRVGSKRSADDRRSGRPVEYADPRRASAHRPRFRTS